MISRQTSRQSCVSQLQPHRYRFFPAKYEKPRMEILGSLIFCLGLTLGKSAWAAPNLGSAQLVLSDTEQQESVGVPSASTEVDTKQSHAEVLPPVTLEESAKEWSQPVNRDSTSIESVTRDQLPVARAMVRDLDPPPTPTTNQLTGYSLQFSANTDLVGDVRTRTDELESLVTGQGSLNTVDTGQQSLVTGQGSLNTVDTGQQSLVTGHGSLNSVNTGKEAETENSSTLAPTKQTNLYPLPLSPSPPLSLSPSCSTTQQQTLPPEQKPQCNPTPPTVVADVENATPPTPQPSPSENSSESEAPASGDDPELGKLRLRELAAPPPPAKPAVYLLGGVGYFRSNNIFSGVDPVDDGVFKAGVRLLAAPSIGPQTSLFASVGGNIYRYSDLSVYDYDELNFSAGIRQRIGSRSYGELGWSNRHLFSQDSGDRFLNDHSVYLELGRRDLLTKKLTLDTFYQLRLSFANPSDRSQVINYLGASLSYTLIPPLELALDYQFAFADFTQQQRQDQYHQLIANLNYTLNRNSRFYLYGGYSFGDSSDKYTDFDGLVLGAGVNFNVTLF